MTGSAKNVTDKALRAWLNAGQTDRGVGDGLTFVASAASARQGKASWILRYRFGGKQTEKVIGRYPDISLKDARELARKDRALLQQGVDVAALKRQEKLKAQDRHNVEELAQAWYARHIASVYKHPERVEGIIRRYIVPQIGKLPVEEVRPIHVDRVLTRIVEAGAPTVANDALQFLFRMFHFAIKRKWIEANPAYGFKASDAGGTEKPRKRWLKREELALFAQVMRDARFDFAYELAVWLLLALCVRKMELLSAQWAEFDLERAVWHLRHDRTKTKATIDIPLAPPVLEWLKVLQSLARGSRYLFPARHRTRSSDNTRGNSLGHISPNALNRSLRRLPLNNLEHFTVHDMRRTARTHLGALGVDHFIAERALNHKIRDVEGVYDQHDYFDQRKEALLRWAELLAAIREGEPVTTTTSKNVSSANVTYRCVPTRHRAST